MAFVIECQKRGLTDRILVKYGLPSGSCIRMERVRTVGMLYHEHDVPEISDSVPIEYKI